MPRIIRTYAMRLQIPDQPFLMPGHLFRQLPVERIAPDPAAKAAPQHPESVEHVRTAA